MRPIVHALGMETALQPAAGVRTLVHSVRGLQVMLDGDLALLYGVSTGRLMEQVRRNVERFPADFMFQLSAAEVEILRSQNAIARSGHGGRRNRPFVFTEQGVAMLSSVLRSPRAIAVNIEIMRAFVALRRVAHEHAAINRRVDGIEAELRERLAEHDAALAAIAEALAALTRPAPRPERRVGFAPTGAQPRPSSPRISP